MRRCPGVSIVQAHQPSRRISPDLLQRAERFLENGPESRVETTLPPTAAVSLRKRATDRLVPEGAHARPTLHLSDGLSFRQACRGIFLPVQPKPVFSSPLWSRQ